MADHKLWNRADVRAEMNRIVKEATNACKAIHVAAGRIAALGAETDFTTDAQTALEALRERAAIAPIMFVSPVSKLSERDEKIVQSVRDASARPLEPKVASAPKADGGLKWRYPTETWRSRGCTCGAADNLVSDSVVHGNMTRCPFRPGAPGWEKP